MHLTGLMEPPESLRLRLQQSYPKVPQRCTDNYTKMPRKRTHGHVSNICNRLSKNTDARVRIGANLDNRAR